MTRPPSPHPLFAIGGGFMAAQLLLCAVELDLFAALGPEGRRLDELAERLQAPPELLRLVLDGLVATELLTRSGARYLDTPVTAAYLSGGPADDLRPFFRHWRRHAYPTWDRLLDALREPAARPDPGHDPGHASWLEAAAAVAPEAARPLADAPELAGCTHVLVSFDPSGAVLTAILRAHPHLRASLAAPASAHADLRSRVAAAGLDERVTLLATDPLAGPFDGDGRYDAAAIVHALHLQAPAANQRLLDQLGRALAPGAPLLLVDHWLDQTRTRPAYAAISSAELRLVTGEGRNYGVDEVHEWLHAVGLEFDHHRALVGPASLIVARRPA
jgi:SAM-dependent methyltransferase